MCQILPQEKVTNFLTSSQDKNLKNIEKTIDIDLVYNYYYLV